MFESQTEISKKIKHIFNVFEKSKAAIRPHFFLTGPSGSGKSYLTNTIAEEKEFTFIEINAAQLTAEGLSGNSLSKALRPLRTCWDKPNIIFVDEFDKLFIRNGETTEGFRSAVQDEFLALLEAKNTSIFTDYGKYEPVKIDNSLFVFAGAFQEQKVNTCKDLQEIGLRTEFVGRVPLVFSTSEVTLEELNSAVTKVALFKEYIKVFPQNTQKAATQIKQLMQEQQKKSGIGIRLLNSCIHQYFMQT